MGKVVELVSFENIPEWTGINNNEKITIVDGTNWDGHGYGIAVGIINEDGIIKSYFKKDKENNNTELFNNLKNEIKLIEKNITYRDYDSYKLANGTQFYVPFMVKNHSSNKPTITECYVDGCSNVRYSVEYEIVLAAGDGFKRYIVFDYSTEGTWASSMFNQISLIEETFEEWFEEDFNGFKMAEECGMSYKTVEFYDDFGKKVDIEINSINELLDMIVSIRMIKCEHEILE